MLLNYLLKLYFLDMILSNTLYFIKYFFDFMKYILKIKKVGQFKNRVIYKKQNKIHQKKNNKYTKYELTEENK